MNILIIDTETTGLKPDDGCKAIEVGAILYSVPFRAPLQSISFLLPTESNPAEHVNNIDPLLTQQSQPWQLSMATFWKMAETADYFIAHNAQFDKQWFGVAELDSTEKPWLCTMTDFNFGDELRARNLRDLALAHGIAVTPDVHRALPDCQLLSSILSRRDDLEELIENAAKPRDLYKALVSYQSREEAKSRGFRWDSDSKQWQRRLTSSEALAIELDGLRVARVEST